jgi:hypothetical protein
MTNSQPLDGSLLLHRNVKAIGHQQQDPQKVKNMPFNYGVVVGKLEPIIPSVQRFYQNLWNNRKMFKRLSDQIKSNQIK